MNENVKIDNVAVVIPSYRVSGSLREVVEGIPAWVRWVVVVDDRCPDGSGDVALATKRDGLEVVLNPHNMGVGGAVVAGYKRALELGAQVVVKMDGDGQMDPAYLEAMVEPVSEGRADYMKGNRFRDFKALGDMPALRLFGNSMLSFLVKAASGYWQLMDPTNGYTAISSDALERLNVDKLPKRYFFESGLLIALNITGAEVQEVEMPARYRGEESSLSPLKALFTFPPLLFAGLIRRIVLRYFLYDFNMASVYMLLGFPLVGFGTVYGVTKWIESISTGVAAPLGTIMLAALPVILGLEMLLQAVHIDISGGPRKGS